MNKKADTMILETFIFIILNLIFFLAVLVFVWKAGDNAFVYEQAYAKEIALAIDNGKPGTSIFIDVKDGLEIADKEKQERNKIFKIDEQEGRIMVNLIGRGGYSFRYFSANEISLLVYGDYLKIDIKEKNE